MENQHVCIGNTSTKSSPSDLRKHISMVIGVQSKLGMWGWSPDFEIRKSQHNGTVQSLFFWMNVPFHVATQYVYITCYIYLLLRMYNDVYSNCYMLKYLKQIVKIITQATPGHPWPPNFPPQLLHWRRHGQHGASWSFCVGPGFLRTE